MTNLTHPNFTSGDDLWVFAYGSLMWNPGFEHLEVVPGEVEGYHRSLCVLSTIYRGTPGNPGLVLGLDEGGSCCGLTFRVHADLIPETVKYLDEREKVTRVYTSEFVNVTLKDGREVEAYTFVVIRDHEQFAGELSYDQQACLVARGIGKNGTALEYLTNTIEHINELGLHDPDLHEVLNLARRNAISYGEKGATGCLD
ncbi:gamma-glutamylcyclotransferase [Magnetovibrio sp. PR-2]|uniref:gamma-glutamylcyclotransferase n=1 Tax=Magnetovibrio sp. PR-2 TaxID=3120356 RepID=UPI002FCE50CD